MRFVRGTTPAKTLALAAVVLAALILWPASGSPAAPNPDWTAGIAGQPASPANGDYAPGQILVKLRASIRPSAISTLAADYDLRELDQIEELGVRLMAVPEGKELEVLAKLSADDRVEYAEPDYLRSSLFIPNDSYYADSQWNLRIVNMPQAWDISRGESSVRVSVVDTGMDWSHPDAPVFQSTGYNYVSNDYDVYDSFGHGTFVSGIIAADTNNSIGVASMAPGVRLVMAKAVNSSGSLPVSAVSKAIANAANNGARVINLSLGSPSTSTTERDAISYAWGKGVLIVAAAGNCGGGASEDCPQANQVEYPAALPNVLAVGSTTSTDSVAGHSTRNSTVDVSAPGQSITGLKSGGGYLTGSGTSFAAPHAAALAGLIFSAKPELTNKQVGDIIVATAKDLGSAGRDDGYGYGRIDAYAALVRATGGAITPTATPTPTATRTRTPTPTPTSGANAGDNAAALSGPYSFTLNPGEKVEYIIKFKNTGTTTWRSSEGYAVKNVERGTTAGLVSGGCDGLQPGGSCSWTWTLTAGTSPGTFLFHYRMYRGGAGFGDVIEVTATVRGGSPVPIATPTPTRTPTPTPTSQANAGDNAAAASSPLNFALDPGQKVDFVLKFKNTGTNTWWTRDGYVLRQVETGIISQLGGCDELWPGWTCTFSDTLTAGTAPGTRSVRYRMYHGDTGFGDTISLTWTVKGATPTPTPTATPTPGAIPPPPPPPVGGAQVTYSAGWNLVAGPAGATFPGAGNILYTFQQGPSYTLQPNAQGVTEGWGYWAYFASDTTVTFGGAGGSSYTTTLNPGQTKMVGNPSGTKSATVTADKIYTYNAKTGYSISFGSATLAVGQGAWAYSPSGGTVTVTAQ